MKPKIDVVLQRALDEGIARGWSQAHKHDPNPKPEWVKETIHDCIMESIYEYFIFDHPENFQAAWVMTKQQKEVLKAAVELVNGGLNLEEALYCYKTISKYVLATIPPDADLSDIYSGNDQ